MFTLFVISYVFYLFFNQFNKYYNKSTYMFCACINVCVYVRVFVLNLKT